MKKHRILIDCTDLILGKQNSGIQRVVKKLLYSLNSLDNKYISSVCPVLLKKGNAYSVNPDVFRKVHLPKNCQAKLNVAKKILIACKEWSLQILPASFVYDINRKLLEKNIDYNETLNEKIRFCENDILILADAGWRVGILESLINAKKANVFIATVIHDLIPVYYKQFVRRCYSNIFKKWLFALHESCDCFICVSKTVSYDLIRFFDENRLDVNKEKVKTFTLGADFIQSDSKGDNVSLQLRKLFDNDCSTYLAVSTIEPRKNHAYLLDVFDKLWGADKSVNLCIVGRDIGVAQKLIKRMKQHLELNKKLFYFDNLNDAEVAYCYKNAKVLLMPSIVEGFGLPVIEGINNSLPVLASDIPIFHETGGDKIDYFDIHSVNDLVDKINKIENGELELKKNVGKIHVNTWKESAEELLLKILKYKTYK